MIVLIPNGVVKETSSFPERQRFENDYSSLIFSSVNKTLNVFPKPHRDL